MKENCLYCWDYRSRQVLKKGHLKIACPGAFRSCSFSMEDEPVDYEVVLHSELQELRQKRDYLIGMGNYEGADYIQEQIADLSYRLNLNFVQIVPI